MIDKTHINWIKKGNKFKVDEVGFGPFEAGDIIEVSKKYEDDRFTDDNGKCSHVEVEFIRKDGVFKKEKHIEIVNEVLDPYIYGISLL